MKRANARIPPDGITIKQNPKTGKLLTIITALVLVTFLVTCFIINDSDSADETQFIGQNIPKTYNKLEGIPPEERDLFHGFQTSFLPAEELMQAQIYSKSKRSLEDPVTSDNFLWDAWKGVSGPIRPKRSSKFTFTSQDYMEDPLFHHHGVQEHDQESTGESYEDYSYDSAETSSQEEKEGFQTIAEHRNHVDRGPLDDVVEQIRSQPELEEGEMESSALHLYKPSSSHSGIQAFWKGQGDKAAIRATQASIMKRNMDVEADPCHDFYQYACGNWAALNPIPADKAGYDTFEMLRENLDAVLKDLLEFNEPFPSKYPGANLDMNYGFLNTTSKKRYQNTHDDNNKLHIDTIDSHLGGIFNSSINGRYRYDWIKTDGEKPEMVNRIHTLFHRKERAIFKTANNTKPNNLKHVKKKRRGNRLRYVHTNRDGEIAEKHGKRKKRSLKGKLSNLKYVVQKTHLSTVRKSRPKRDTKTNLPISDDFTKTDDAALKAKFLFKSCMNYEILQKRGHQPLLDLLNLFGGWPILDPAWLPLHFNWLEVMAKLRLYNNDILISEWVGPDIKNSDEYVIQFDQTSLGLPTREYFLQSSNKVYLDAYKHYLIKIALLLGGSKNHVLHSAEKLINFEIKLANITSAPEDRRNVSELYRRMTLRKLEKLVPEIGWRRYLCAVMNRTVHSHETVVLFALTYVQHLVKLIHATDPEVLANYLLWRFVRHRVNNLDDRFQSAKQQFYFILFGREQSPPRWKNCISQVNSNMGMALGSMFVRKHFDETSKNDTLTMTREIQQSFRELLHKIDWIDSETKNLAAQKVDAMMLRIGYPDFILNKKELDQRYKDVKIHPDKYFENTLNILQHLTQMEQSRIGEPVNKTLWNTAPAVVNAYYSRNKNQIMFPAGILQPPFYHRHFPRSLNYGGIGVVIGHELTHGFDDKGRLFDCNGNLHRWWSDSAIEAFHRRAQCLIDQYGHYVVPEVNMKLDGVNTQGENIADNGGVKQAFRAYIRWVQKNGVADETLPGLNHTHTQLFFLNFAQVWCGAMRAEAMRNKLKTAVHSPGRFRVIGTLSNSNDFAREFKCPLGSPMNPKEKCTVW
ncbi:LOW QUALITY PROTEIN: neprilysin-4-like [Cydia pomonella]|uniref:LOW QUALITY PROTEIN: neprilysin-4-like n=1 Tax=Cydia pomonella TaxID=82600 RepID=UPI002ADE7410|nr:LOW QUALITY PROTEIN: neprilysin-4-like [Cydia pomonella]